MAILTDKKYLSFERLSSFLIKCKQRRQFQSFYFVVSLTEFKPSKCCTTEKKLHENIQKLFKSDFALLKLMLKSDKIRNSIIML